MGYGGTHVLWLGITDLKKFGHFVKESNGEELSYTNWDARSPIDDAFLKRGAYHCTYMPMVRKTYCISLPLYCLYVCRQTATFYLTMFGHLQHVRPHINLIISFKGKIFAH